ncbi:UDP-glucuronosyltransferase 2C1 [Drosophila novamexicana]|uniref:UDP-glucuronosyltransferase 2C1 n=1 Tax=Drosophila novamexicana TaxID=47314 RepID=UPI0011E5FF8C|nr:UDP-glucuronosyltransferase 2C1 [Drosophila novamexicana]
MQAICAWKLLLLLSLFSVNSSTHALKILGLFPHPALSHFQFFQPLMRRLAETGHNVDVVSPFRYIHPPTGYKDYALPSANLNDKIGFDMFEKVAMPHLMPFTEFFILHGYGKAACNTTLNSAALAQILRHPTGYYDVIVLEQFNTDCMMGVAHQLQSPVVAMSSCALMPWHYERMGAPIIPSYMPALFLGESQHMHFAGRLGNWLTTHALNWLYGWYSVPAADALLRQRFGAGLPSTGELVKNTSLMLVNQHYSLSGAKPLPPNVIEVGGLHVSQAKPLHDALQQLLDKAKHGVIIISWGSQLRANTLSDAKREGLLRALARLPQQIIWKWENVTLAEQPPNVHIMKWLPQRDLLAHPNVRLFFTHGGLMGVTEAVASGVPILGMPVYGDQHLNVAALVERGMAVRLDFERLREQTAFEALSQALDAKYKRQAQKIAAAYNERPQLALETALWWVQHVAETRGAPLLQSGAVRLNRFVYYSLDVYVALACALLLFLAIATEIWRRCCKRKQPVEKPKRS